MRKIYLLLTMVLLGAMVLSACGAPAVAPAADSGDAAAELTNRPLTKAPPMQQPASRR